MLVDLIVGTRPNFVKVAPLIKELDKRKKKNVFNINYRLIHTGQHYSTKLSEVFFKDLKIPKPKINFNVGSFTHSKQVAKIMIAYEKVLLKKKPNMVIVFGDVNSTVACAITAKRFNIICAHVEAGIRSFDNSMPEELNRIITDSVSDYFFTTSKFANQNLLNQGVSKKKIFFIGNLMIDSLLDNLKKFKAPKIKNLNISFDNDEYYILTLHRPTNVDNKVKLNEIITFISKIMKNKKIIFLTHPRTKKNLLKSKTTKNIHFLKPLGYLEFNYLLKNSSGIITDSAGISEESSVLNKPCITLRDTTERLETIIFGTNVLSMNKASLLKKYINRMISGKWKRYKKIEKWDGKSSSRLVDILEIFKKIK